MSDIVVPTDLAHALAAAIPPPIRDVLALVVDEARAVGMPCYIIGGPVRDLLLGHELDDLDVVFEGDALVVAERCAALTGGELVRHEAFGTGKLLFADAARHFHVDFITARRETYPHPTSLPVVEPSGLHDDLRRRDFTINTLAIRLDDPPVLIDQLGGIADLERGIVRVLHDQSFMDDPTRIVRGARFAARLGFAVEPHTARLAREAVAAGMIERTTPIRILNDIWLAYREPVPEAVFGVLADLDVLPAIFPGLHWRPEIAAAFQEARRFTGETRRLVLLALSAWWLRPDDRRATLQRYAFSSDERRRITELDALDTLFARPDLATMPPSTLDRELRPLSESTLHVAQIVAAPDFRPRLVTYEQVERHTTTLLDGNDLRALGIAPGPRFRVLLDGLRAAQLDGLVSTRPEAEAWVNAQQNDL